MRELCLRSWVIDTGWAGEAWSLLARYTAQGVMGDGMIGVKLIYSELDKFGLGRYQICIWFLCGFG
jgi:hypothetical protein